MFSGVRANQFLYILEKGERPTLKVGQVISVSNPMSKFGGPMPAFGQAMDSVVDISVKVGEDVKEFKQLPSTMSVANLGPNIIISDSRDGMISEVEGMAKASRDLLESVPFHQSVISSCEVILRELNPRLAKEIEQEAKIGELQGQVSQLTASIGQIHKMLADALQDKGAGNKKEK